MGNLFACMKAPTEGVPPVEITVKANCCNSKTVKVSLEDLSHLPQVLELVRSLSKNSSSRSSLTESATIAKCLPDPSTVKEPTMV